MVIITTIVIIAYILYKQYNIKSIKIKMNSIYCNKYGNLFIIYELEFNMNWIISINDKYIN